MTQELALFICKAAATFAPSSGTLIFAQCLQNISNLYLLQTDNICTTITYYKMALHL